MKVQTYCSLVDTYLDLEFKNLDPNFDRKVLYSFTNEYIDISFSSFKFTCDVINGYKKLVKGTDDFDLMNEAYRLILKFMEHVITGTEVEHSSLSKLFVSEIKSIKRKRKYFEINELTVKLLNGK